jgi:parallel beta-helix repeat protein
LRSLGFSALVLAKCFCGRLPLIFPSDKDLNNQGLFFSIVEEYQLKRKWLAVGIILLFVGTCIIPVMAQNTEKPSSTSRGWLYVGGSGPGNYTTIQSAIDHANPSDTVFVYSGLYLENVMVDKPLDVRGEERNTTIIDGGGIGDVVKITSDSVNLCTFTVRHGQNGIFLEYSNDCTITGNRIHQMNDFGSGIILERSHHNTIINNMVIECPGILLEASDNNTIQSNYHILNHYYCLQVSTSEGNLIENNTFENTRWSGIGQVSLIMGATNNVVKNNCFINDSLFLTDAGQNQILNNTVNGKPLIYLERSSGNVIDYPAGQIILMYSDNVKVRNQTDIAIHVLGCNNCRFENISSRTNLSVGLFIWYSQYINITNCVVSECTYGVQIWHSSQFKIQNTLFWKNSYVAIYILNGTDISIAHNSFEENGGLTHPMPGAISIVSSISIAVQWNNFIRNVKGTYFRDCPRKAILWDENYWDRPRMLPKVIPGRLYRFNFDWHPAQEPYDIPGMS